MMFEMPAVPPTLLEPALEAVFQCVKKSKSLPVVPWTLKLKPLAI